MKKNIVHLTSVHPRYDTRIFLKQCVSLFNAGYGVHLIVADGQGDEVKNGVNFYDVGKSGSRLNRIFNVTQRILSKALILNADIYHLHDPELIPIGLKLKKLGKTVFFDAHEDVPVQILGKPYLNFVAKWCLSNAFSIYEKWSCRKLDAVIAATPFIRDKFLKIGVFSIDVNNYPLLQEFTCLNNNWNNKERQVCYIGGISRIRGFFEMVHAMDFVDSKTRMQLGGAISQEDEIDAKAIPGWSKVDALGWLDRDGVKNIMQKSVAGLVTLHPLANYMDALPVKMFEYMAAGLPVIASDFPVWREILEENSCGLCVDPLMPSSIAKAINYFVDNPENAKIMGDNGKKAVFEKYNWNLEEAKLLELYEKT